MNAHDIRFNHPHDDSVSIEAVVAGTLCLMSCAMQTGSALYIRKLIDNLEVMASCPTLSSELRSVCRRLSGHWQYAADQAERTDGNPVCAILPVAHGIH